MSIAGRTLSLLGLLAFGPGVMLYWLSAYTVCLDYCPPDLSGTLSRALLVWVGPGFVLSWLAWALSLLSSAQARRWTQCALVLRVLLLSVGGVIALWLRASQGGVFPTQEDQLSSWFDLVWWGLLPFAVAFSFGAFRVHFASPRTMNRRSSWFPLL